MKILKIISVLFAVGVMLTSCLGKAQTQSSSQPDSKAEKKPTLHEDGYYIKWAIPDSISISDKTLEKINMILEERYDLGVSFVSISDTEDYANELKKTNADIAFSGFDSEDKKPCEQLIADGYFAPLDDLLEGSELYEALPTQLWECSKINGSTFVLPNETAQNIGISIVFDLDKINRAAAESFDGDITKLPILLQDGGLLEYGLQGFEFMGFYGYYYADGRLYSPDGKEGLPLENESAITWLKTVNGLFLSGNATDDINADWSICITRDLPAVKKNNTYIYSTKCIIGPRFSATTGILKSSDKKERAFKLLQAVHLDHDIGNLLVYGTDAEVRDGCAYTADGELMYGYINKLIFGINTGLLKDGDMLMRFESFEELNNYYDENVAVCNNAKIITEADEQAKVMNSLSEVYKSKSFDEDIKAARAKLHK